MEHQLREADDRDRLKSFILDQDLFFEMLTGMCHREAVRLPCYVFPEDARIVSAEWSAAHRGFFVVVHSREFDVRQPGTYIEAESLIEVRSVPVRWLARRVHDLLSPRLLDDNGDAPVQIPRHTAAVLVRVCEGIEEALRPTDA